MRRLGISAVLILVCLVGLSGCYDVEEINRRAIILAFGFDPAPAGMVGVSAQIPVIMDLHAPSIGGGTAPSKPFHMIAAESDISFGAAPVLQSKTGKDLFAGQLKTVIISTDLAKRGLKPYIDFLERHPEIPPQVIILLTRGNAEEILNFSLSSKEISGMSVYDFLQSAPKADLTYALREWQLLSAATEGPEDAYLPFIEIDPLEQTYRISGLGVFHRDRLVGELSDIETRMFGLLAGKAQDAYPSVFVDQKIGTVSFRGVKAKTRVKAIRRGSRIEFLFKVRADGVLIHLTTAKTHLTIKDIQVIEAKMEHAVKAEMLRTIHRLQELNSDILGMGELVRATQPRLWSRRDWDKEYPQAKVRVDFKFNIARSGSLR